MEDYSYTKFICFYNSATKHFLRWDRNNTKRTNTSLSHYFPVHLGAVHMVRRYVGTVGMHSMYTITDQGQCVTGPPACPCSKTYSSRRLQFPQAPECQRPRWSIHKNNIT